MKLYVSYFIYLFLFLVQIQTQSDELQKSNNFHH